MLVGLETLPNRGRLTLAVERGERVRISVVTEGDGVALRPEVRAVLRPDIDAADLTARTVQGHFTAWLAHTLGGTLTIEADRPARVAISLDIPTPFNRSC